MSNKWSVPTVPSFQPGFFFKVLAQGIAHSYWRNFIILINSILAYYIFWPLPDLKLSSLWSWVCEEAWYRWDGFPFLSCREAFFFLLLLSLPKPQVMLSFPEGDRLPRRGCQREFGACEQLKWISPDKPDLQIKILLWYLPKVYIASEDTSDRQTLIACVNQLLQISYNQKQNAWEKINGAINNSDFDAFWNQGRLLFRFAARWHLRCVTWGHIGLHPSAGRRSNLTSTDDKEWRQLRQVLVH